MVGHHRPPVVVVELIVFVSVGKDAAFTEDLRRLALSTQASDLVVTDLIVAFVTGASSLPIRPDWK